MSEFICGTDGHEGHWLTGEEIVRCRDCAKFVTLSIADYEFCGCTRFESEGEDMQSADPDGFCAWGERKVEE